MGVVIPQVIAEDRSSGAQIIDGSLNFKQNPIPCLEFTPSSDGNRSTWTISFWARVDPSISDIYHPFFLATADNYSWEYEGLHYSAGNLYYIDYISSANSGTYNILWRTNAVFRDTGWYHIMVVKESNSTLKLYVNGEEQTSLMNSTNNGGQSTWWNKSGQRMTIGGHVPPGGGGNPLGCQSPGMSQFYFADGQALGPEEFGFTDPLTGTWRPKKYEGSLAKYTVPSGYTYWSGMNQNWSSGGTTSSGNDYINSALPSDTKVYWEVTVNSPATYRQVGISEGAAGSGTGYNDNMFGFYMNNVSLGPVMLTKNAGGVSKNGSVSHSERASVWNDGDTVMWAWDPINDGIYFGLNGTWYGGGDPARGNNPAIVGEDLSAASFYFKQGRTDSDNTQTHTNITSSNATYFTDLSEVTIGANSFYLPMDGNSPIGEDKSGNSNINDGTIWGNDVTTSNGYSANRDPGKGFDGNSSLVGQSDTYVQSDNSSGTVTWTPNGYTIDTADEILVKGISSLDRLSVVGSLGSQSNIAPATVNGITNVYTIPTNLGTLTSLTVTGNSSLAGWSGISVGGILLVDGRKGNSWTPVNFGGSNTIEKATGALPILNTVSGGNVATVGVRTDATVAAGVGTCVLALPFANPGGSTKDVSNQIDSGSTEKVITASGNAVGFSTNNFYGRGWYFDGQSTTYVEASASNDFVVGTGDFTIEGWFNPNATQVTNGRLWGQQNPGTTSEANADYDCYIGGSFGTSDIQMNGGNTDLGMNFPTAGEWHHIAVCRSGTTLYSFMNGVLKKVTPNYTNNLGNNTDTFRIAKIGGNNTGFAFAGGVQDFRFYKGVAKYTSDFIPASTNPDILPDTPSGVSGSSKLTKITDGSVNFDGNATETSTGLTVTTNIDWSSDFTVEGFYYPNELGGGRTLFDCWSGNTDGTGFYVWTNANGSIDLVKNSNTYYSSGWCGSGSISSNKWSHFAIVRSSNTLYMYIDGVNKSGSGYSISDSWSSSRGCILGSGSGNISMQSVNGFMNNVRISQTAVYTSNFTPPTTSLSSLGADTKVLGLKSQQSVTSTEVGTITDVGGTAATNFNPFTTDINTVRGQETGYATFNPLATQKNGTITLSDGNLRATVGATRTSAYASLPFVGKMYYEVTYVVDRAYVFGMAPSIDFNTTADSVGQRYIGESSGSYGVGYDGTVYNNGVSNYQGSSLSSTFGLNDCMGWAYDSDSGQVSVYKNGVLQATFTASTSRTYYPAITLISSSAAAEVNFGQKPFKFPPPDGFQPLNNANVRPKTVIARPDQYVGVTTYSGNVSSGTGTQQIKVGTQPDLVWIKKRFSTNAQHRLVDSVRGPNEELYSDTDQNSGSNNGLNSFDPDGFTVWTSNAGYNELGQDYVAWTWKAGGEVGVGRSFMIDDVGYANASDANMNAGALNSTIYDQSEVWSTNSTMTLASGAFDGTTEGSSGNANYSNSGNVLTSSSITINSKLEIYTNRTHTGAQDGTKITINGVDYYDKPLASTGYSEIDLSGATLPLTTTGNITITDTQGTSGLWSVRVDGKRLVDSNATPPNVPAISATSGSIGTKQGFSIVKYTGSGTDNDTVPHGLSQKPDLVIVKNIGRSSTEWRVWHSAFGDNRNLKLGSDGAQNKNYWGDGNVYGYTSSDTSIILSGPPSTTTADDVNRSGDKYIIYSWHNVPGLQKFGSFAGNGVADGPFIELGFRPAIIWVKNVNISGYNWVVKDSETEKQNPVSDYLLLNSSGNTATGLDVDFLSNGFKLRNANGNMNRSASSDLYIYCAWAESPSVNLYGGQSNAR